MVTVMMDSGTEHRFHPCNALLDYWIEILNRETLPYLVSMWSFDREKVIYIRSDEIDSVYMEPDVRPMSVKGVFATMGLCQAADEQSTPSVSYTV